MDLLDSDCYEIRCVERKFEIVELEPLLRSGDKVLFVSRKNNLRATPLLSLIPYFTNRDCCADVFMFYFNKTLLLLNEDVPG